MQIKAYILKKRGVANKGNNQHTPKSELSTIDKKHNTQKEIAKDLGWSTGKVAMADKI